jgi:hypothetical protein
MNGQTDARLRLKFSDFPGYIIEFGPGAYVVSAGFMMECPFGSR